MTAATDTAPAPRPGLVRVIWRRTGFAPALLIVLLIVNIWLNPVRFAPGNWGILIGLAAPLIGAALASTPAILGGRGGIDVSVGPTMGFVNAILVKVLITDLGLSSPFVIIAAALLIGIVVGAVNGFLAAYVRIQPIVATLGTYLILIGVTLTILPSPMGTVPDWLKTLNGPLSVVPIAAIFLIWWGIRRFPDYDQLMATGSDDRAAFTAGVPVPFVRFLSYVITGLFAGIAGADADGPDRVRRRQYRAFLHPDRDLRRGPRRGQPCRRARRADRRCHRRH